MARAGVSQTLTCCLSWVGPICVSNLFRLKTRATEHNVHSGALDLEIDLVI